MVSDNILVLQIASFENPCFQGYRPRHPLPPGFNPKLAAKSDPTNWSAAHVKLWCDLQPVYSYLGELEIAAMSERVLHVSNAFGDKEGPFFTWAP